MSYRYGYPYVLELSYDYVAQVLTSALRSEATYRKSISLNLGGAINFTIVDYVPRIRQVRLAYDGGTGVTSEVTIEHASGSLPPPYKSFVLTGTLEALIRAGQFVAIGARGRPDFEIAFLNDKGAEIAKDKIDHSSALQLGLRGWAHFAFDIKTTEIYLTMSAARLEGRKSGIVVGTYGASATAPRGAAAPGTTYQALPSPTPARLTQYKGYLGTTAQIGVAVDDFLLEIAGAYVGGYLAVEFFKSLGVTAAIQSATATVDKIAWPTSVSMHADATIDITTEHWLFGKGIKTLRFNGEGPPYHRIPDPGGPARSSIEVRLALQSFQEWDVQSQRWGDPNTMIKGHQQIWLSTINTEYGKGGRAIDIDPVAIGISGQMTDMLYVEGQGSAVPWDNPKGSIAAKNNERILYVRKGVGIELDAANAAAQPGHGRVDFKVLSHTAPPGLRVTGLPLSVAPGVRTPIGLINDATGYTSGEIVFITNDGAMKLPVEMFEIEGQYGVPGKVVVKATNFRDYREAGGFAGSDFGHASLSATWVPGPPSVLTVSRPSPRSEFSIVGPSTFVLSKQNPRQTFQITFNAGLRRPTEPPLVERIEIKSATESSPRTIELVGEVLRPQVYIPDILLGIVALAYEYSQMKDAVFQMQRYRERMNQGPILPRPAGPGPDPLPPFAFDWMIARAPLLRNGASLAFKSTADEPLASSTGTEEYGALGVIAADPETAGYFDVVPPPASDAWIELMLEYWTERVWSKQPFGEPIRALTWWGNRLLAGTEDCIKTFDLSRSGRLTPGSEFRMEDAVEGLWATADRVMIFAAGELRIADGLDEHDLSASYRYPMDRPPTALAPMLDNDVLLFCEGRAQLVRLGPGLEVISDHPIDGSVSLLLPVGIGSLLAFSREQCFLVRYFGEGMEIEPVGNIPPIARVVPLDRTLVLRHWSGEISVMGAFASGLRIAGRVDRPPPLASFGIPVAGISAADGTGRIAAFDRETGKLTLREYRRLTPNRDAVEAWLG